MKFNRSQLAKFLPDNEAIRQFEELAFLATETADKVGSLTLVRGITAPDTTLVTAAFVPVAANNTYKFEFFGIYTCSLGTRWTVDGPIGTVIYTSEYSLSATAKTVNNVNDYLLPASANASSAAGNTVKIDGIVTPSVNGTLSVQFASAGVGDAVLLSGYLRLIRLT